MEFQRGVSPKEVMKIGIEVRIRESFRSSKNIYRIMQKRKHWGYVQEEYNGCKYYLVHVNIGRHTMWGAYIPSQGSYSLWELKTYARSAAENVIKIYVL